MLRSLFLNIIPKDLKTKILEDPSLQLAEHRVLAEWCKGRALILQREHLTSVARKNMSQTYGGSVKTLRQSDSASSRQPPAEDGASTEPPPPWLAAFGEGLIAAIKPSTPSRKSDTTRGRPERKDPKNQRNSSRSTSRGRRFLEGWGKRCNHCGSADHLKKDCKEFDSMMKKANVGKPKDQWKPPEGYKSALGHARDAARAAEQKSKKVAALEGGEDSASDDESDLSSNHGGSFRVFALTRALPPRRSTEPPRICAVNKFAGLDEHQEYDPETLSALNQWAHNVRVSPKKERRPKPENPLSAKLNRTLNYVNGGKKPDAVEEFPVLKEMKVDPNRGPRTDKETDVILRQISAYIPPTTANKARAARRIGNWDLEDDELLALVDTGSFTHAIDAGVELPDHQVQLCDPDAPGTSAETAGGAVLKKLGTVATTSIIDGIEVGIQWDHMQVSTPILSVRKLVKDGNDVYINKQGGYIRHLASGKTMKIYNFQGVYYLRMKITSGNPNQVEPRPDFHRPGQ